MGKGGSAKALPRGPAADDDALLDAAIAENKAEKAAQERKSTESKQQPYAALTRDQIIAKLNNVPTFCLLNGESNIVGMEDPEKPEFEVCFWMTDPAEAKDMLEAAKAANPPDVAQALHLGVTPLGYAYALSEGWAETSFYGDMRLRGTREEASEGENVQEMLRKQVKAQGLKQASWQLPIFCCDELQSPKAMPVFLSRKALAETWIVSGRKLAEMPAQQAVMDLRVLVEQMQTGVFAWETVQFITCRKSISLVQTAKAAAVVARGHATAGAPAGDAEDGPPPLAAAEDDGPPPLE